MEYLREHLGRYPTSGDLKVLVSERHPALHPPSVHIRTSELKQLGMLTDGTPRKSFVTGRLRSPLVPVTVEPTDQELRDFTRVKFISSHVGEAVWSRWTPREWSKVLGHDEESCQPLFQVMRAAEESGQIVWDSDKRQYRRGGVKGRETES